jgi:hypothetical protein
MPEPRDVDSIVESAQQAAAAGDHASAEQLLREAALLQEANLGPLHPDLANTLNNLGVVYEITNRPAEAEDCYRRAYAIVKAVLEPGHPFVATSGKNLRDFCEARGRPVDAPVAPPSPAAPQTPLATAASMAPAEGVVDVPRERALHEELRPSKRSSRVLAIGAICVFVVLIVTLIATRAWFGSNVGAGFSPDEKPRALPASPAARIEPVPAAPIPEPNDTAASRSRPAAVREGAGAAASALGLPSVAEARVCRNLSTRGSRDWRCDAVSSPVEPGTFFFYTRLTAARDTTVQHRWYQGDRLHQAVELRVRANPRSGYRTYSRNTVSSPNAGDWRVELRAKDGTLLDEKRFTVR